jgi:hypothetical protein
MREQDSEAGMVTKVWKNIFITSSNYYAIMPALKARRRAIKIASSEVLPVTGQCFHDIRRKRFAGTYALH